MKKILSIAITTLILTSCISNNSNNEDRNDDAVVIGSINSKEGEPKPIVAGDTSNQQVWMDYIKAHNDRDLDKIAAINAEDWEGYASDGTPIKGTEAHIALLDNWFKSSNPKWTVKWMIANAGEDDKGVMTQWLTTGNDLTDTDEEGNEILEHHIHDIQFIDGKIKNIFVYSRSKTKE